MFVKIEHWKGVSEAMHVVQLSIQRSKTYVLFKKLLLFVADNLRGPLGILTGLLLSKRFGEVFSKLF